MRVISDLGRVAALILLAPGLCGGCASTRSAQSPDGAITATLQAQAAAWNEGDVERFMEPYWHSPDLTFSSGGRVTRGWRETLDGYRRRYPDRAAMGRLTFNDLEVTMLGRGAALVLGRWHLDRAEPVGGNFSLVFRRIGGRWVIVHDHTSTQSTQTATRSP